MKEDRTIWTYTNVSPTKWQNIQQICQEKYGFSVTGNAGITHFIGVKVKYHYDPKTAIGQITLLEKPLIFPTSVIKDKIDSVFNDID